jgi:hypothetical protein
LRRHVCLTVLLATSAACELHEIVVADAEPLLVVESVLRSDLRLQTVLLHRGVLDGIGAGERGAAIRVRNETTGREFAFREVDPNASESCAEGGGGILQARPTCYISRVEDGAWVRPGHSYSLLLASADGLRATGRTTVPGAYRMVTPSALSRSSCSLIPDEPLSLMWTRAEGAWAYLAELEISRLPEALASSGLDDIPDRVRLSGLSISEADTTMILPTDFGIFQRAVYDRDLLLALRHGLPAGADARLVIAAVDRNFVNGVRGGTFNPSGRVRVPSVFGDAVGVFGSATGYVLDFRVEHSPHGPACFLPR